MCTGEGGIMWSTSHSHGVSHTALTRLSRPAYKMIPDHPWGLKRSKYWQDVAKEHFSLKWGKSVKQKCIYDQCCSAMFTGQLLTLSVGCLVRGWKYCDVKCTGVLNLTGRRKLSEETILRKLWWSSGFIRKTATLSQTSSVCVCVTFEMCEENSAFTDFKSWLRGLEIKPCKLPHFSQVRG